MQVGFDLRGSDRILHLSHSRFFYNSVIPKKTENFETQNWNHFCQLIAKIKQKNISMLMEGGGGGVNNRLSLLGVLDVWKFKGNQKSREFIFLKIICRYIGQTNLCSLIGTYCIRTAFRTNSIHSALLLGRPIGKQFILTYLLHGAESFLRS